MRRLVIFLFIRIVTITETGTNAHAQSDDCHSFPFIHTAYSGKLIAELINNFRLRFFFLCKIYRDSISKANKIYSNFHLSYFTQESTVSKATTISGDKCLFSTPDIDHTATGEYNVSELS